MNKKSSENWTLDSIMTKSDSQNSEAKETRQEAPSSPEVPQEKMVDIHCKIPTSLRKRMRVQCAMDEQMFKDFIIDAITERLERKEKGAHPLRLDRSS